MIPEKCPHCGMTWAEWMGEYECGSYPAGSSMVRATACTEIENLRKRVTSMDRLVASVPDLVKQAFQEGFASNAETLGKAWDRSNARKALDGEAQPRPPSWDADKEEIARLKAQLSQAERVVVPELKRSCVTCADGNGVGGCRLAEPCCSLEGWHSSAHSVPASRVLKDGEVAVDAVVLERSLDDVQCLLDCVRMNHWTGAVVDDVATALDALRAQGKETP